MTKPASGLYNSYDLTVGTIVDIDPLIRMLSPSDVPLLGQNGADGSSAISQTTCFETRVDWLDEELLLPVATITTTQITASTSLVVNTGEGLRFSVGDIIATAAERQQVTAISTDTLTVTRAVGGTTAAQQAAGGKVLILGQALAEGSDPEAPRAKDRVLRSNFTQIFGPTAIRVSGTENVVKKYGTEGTTEFDKQVANRAREQLIQLEQAIMYGRQITGSTSAGRAMGGIDSFISTNVDAATTTLTEAKLLDQLQNIFDAGGRADRIVVGSKQKRVISGFASYNGTGVNLTVNTDSSANTRGSTVDTYNSDFGQVSIMLDRWCRTADLFIFDRDQPELATLRPMQFEMLAKTGDSIYGQIVQERSLRFYRERHAAKFTALT